MMPDPGANPLDQYADPHCEPGDDYSTATIELQIEVRYWWDDNGNITLVLPEITDEEILKMVRDELQSDSTKEQLR